MTKEVILNDECAHCKDKECHDGEHFCNQAMKDNSFYKNAKLYKGLEVIKRPTYEELEKEYAEAKEIIKKLVNIIAENIDAIDTEQKGLNYKQAIDFIKEEEETNGTKETNIQ